MYKVLWSVPDMSDEENGMVSALKQLIVWYAKKVSNAYEIIM